METVKEIGGHEYQIGKLNAFEQLHVARRLAPVLGALFSAFQGSPKLKKGEKAEDKVMELAAGPVAEVLAGMDDETVDFIINKCLSVCKRKQGPVWAKMTSGSTLMFQDLELDALMGLTVAVISENLGRFFPTSQPKSEETK
jgi:hypothetical protein